MALKIIRITLVAIPLVFLIVVPLFIGGTEPRVLGMPPIMAWITFSVVITSLCLWSIERLRTRA